MSFTLFQAHCERLGQLLLEMRQGAGPLLAAQSSLMCCIALDIVDRLLVRRRLAAAGGGGA
jgi:hypothetical protein